MSSPTTRGAYRDCYDLWDRAIDANNGIRFRVPTESAAINLRMRMHQSRSIIRDESRRMLDPSDPKYGISVYDPWQVLVRTEHDGIWVYIEPRSVPIIGEIEELQPEDNTQWLDQSFPQKLISHSGIERLEKRLELESSVPIESSSSTPSTKPENNEVIPRLRRL